MSAASWATSAEPGPRTVLCCTDCGEVWAPDLADPAGHTGCRVCGGWTWIGELAERAGGEHR